MSDAEILDHLVECLRSDPAVLDSFYSEGFAVKAADVIERLRADLLDQWESNHWEHCGHDCPDDPPLSGCHWPKPASLDGPDTAAARS